MVLEQSSLLACLPRSLLPDPHLHQLCLLEREYEYQLPAHLVASHEVLCSIITILGREVVPLRC